MCSTCTQRRAWGDCLGCGNPVKVIGGNQMGMQGVGCGFRQCQLAHRLALPETNAIVACIVGMTRSAFARRSRHTCLRVACWAMVRMVGLWAWISAALSVP